MRYQAPFALIAASALALALAGCATGGGAELTYEDSPLNKYLSAAFGGDMSPEEQQKQFEEQQRAQEELMAECMAKEGFEYTPNVIDSSTVFASEDDGAEWEPDKKEWVEKYGYGIVDNPFNSESSENTEEAYVDPNQEYLDSLSESERNAFYETAYGVPPTEDEMSEDGTYEYNWEDSGCQGWAQHEMEGENPWMSDEFAELRDKMSELWSSTQDAPEFKELNAAWASCMDDNGEPGFKTQQEASQSIADEQSKIFEAAYGDGTTEVDPSTIEDPNDSPEMKELGEREIELALVDLGCREKTDYTAKSLEIQFTQEEQFIKDNKAELEAFKAAAEQGS